MQNASGTPSSRQLDATPTSQFAFSMSSAGYGGGQSGGSGTPPSSPRFNLPNSYWTQRHDQWNAEQLSRPRGFSEYAARLVAESRQGQDNFFKALERNQEDRENDPQSRIQGPALQINIRPFQIPDMSLSPEILADFLVLRSTESEESQPQSSTSSTATSAATAVEQETAASDCCIPPACTIL